MSEGKPARVWVSEEMRHTWAEAVSPRVVVYFEMLALSRAPSAQKSPPEHETDSGIPRKYVVG
jgi:hypothetical protein